MAETKKINVINKILEPALFIKVMLVIMLLLNFPYIGDAAKMIMKAVPVWGGIVFAFNMRYVKELTKGKFYGLLILMAFSYSITIAINYKYSLVQNIKSLIWYVIYFGILLIWWRNGKRSRQKIYEDIKQINWFVIIVNLFNVLPSIALFAANVTLVTHNRRPMGIHANRLFCIMDGVNHSVMIALISVVAIAMNRRLDDKESRFKKTLYIINVICTYIVIVASGTRSVRFIMIALIAFYCFIREWKKQIGEDKPINKTKGMWKSVLAGILAFVLTYVLVEATRYFVGMLPVLGEEIKQCISRLMESRSIENSVGGSGGMEKLFEDSFVIRDVDGEQCSTAQRMDIWRECIAIWKDHPWWGVGNANYTESTHSLPIALLIYSGIFGTIIFISYLVCRMVTGLAVLMKKGKWTDVIWSSMLFSFMICIALCMFGILDTVIIFSNVENTVLFWIYLSIMEAGEYFIEFEKEDNVNVIG